MKRTLLLCLVSFVAVATSGCACHPWVFGPGTVCEPSGCGPCSATACGPTACDSACEPVCDDCGEGACSEPCGTACGPDPCAACCPPRGPLTWLFALLSHGYCGPSCGEVWWGDWHGAPPDCNDPCDRCGEYTGRGVPACDSCGQHTGGGAPACESCGGGYAGKVRRSGPTSVAASRASGNPTRQRVASKPSRGHITDTASKYAPQLMSTTDRVVDTNRPGTVPQATLPRRIPAPR